MISQRRKNIYGIFLAPQNTQKILLRAFAAFLLFCGVGFASDIQPPPQMEGKISLDLRNIDAVDALKFLAMKTGLNLVWTKAVSGRVSLSVDNVNIQDVFDIMLRLNNLAYDRTGDIYNVMTEDEYRLLYGKKFSDTRRVKVFRLNYAIPEQAFNLLEATKSEIGRLLVDSESGTIMLMDTPEKIGGAQAILEKLEQKNSIKIFNLKYAKAKDIEEQLKAQLDLKKAGTIKADERSNQLVVQTLPERMGDIEKLIQGLDKKTRAVLVDTKIVKIKFSNQLDSGIEWEGILRVAGQYGLNYLGSYPFSAIQKATDTWKSREQFFRNTMDGAVGAYPFSGTAVDTVVGSKVSPGEKMHIGVVDKKRDWDILVKYLQTLGKTKILANPTLTVIDNQEAKVHVGERRAYVTTTTTTGSTTKTTAEEVTYVDVGVQLHITPTINEDGYVTMKVKPEISSVIGSIKTPEGNSIPIIDTSTAETIVMAKDGSSVILAGLGREEKSETSEQVPFLGSIPGLGLLFRSKTQKVERTELLIMLTPIIYTGDRLITAKDKDEEKFGIKPLKKFDVFRKEYPIEVVSPPKPMAEGKELDPGRGGLTAQRQEDMDTYFPAQEEGLKEAQDSKLVPKGLKAYSAEEILLEQIPGIPLALEEKKAGERVILKGFRQYNN